MPGIIWVFLDSGSLCPSLQRPVWPLIRSTKQRAGVPITREPHVCRASMKAVVWRTVWTIRTDISLFPCKIINIWFQVTFKIKLLGSQDSVPVIQTSQCWHTSTIIQRWKSSLWRVAKCVCLQRWRTIQSRNYVFKWLHVCCWTNGVLRELCSTDEDGKISSSSWLDHDTVASFWAAIVRPC